MLDQMDLGWKSWKAKWGKVGAAAGTDHTKARRPSGRHRKLEVFECQEGPPVTQFEPCSCPSWSSFLVFRLRVKEIKRLGILAVNELAK